MMECWLDDPRVLQSDDSVESEEETDNAKSDYQNSEAWKFLENHFTKRVTQMDLIRLAEVLEIHLLPQFPEMRLQRLMLRRKASLCEWYQKFYHIIKPFIEEHIVIERYDGQFVGPEKVWKVIAGNQIRPPVKKEVTIDPI